MNISVFAVHQLPGGDWEFIGPDSDPTHPSWRRYAVVSRARAPREFRRRSVAKMAPRKDLEKYPGDKNLRLLLAEVKD
jgi:hypothetical protein